jgi:hypothetical protein
MSAAKNLVRRVWGGLTTGAADADPSGIATYSQANWSFLLRCHQKLTRRSERIGESEFLSDVFWPG